MRQLPTTSARASSAKQQARPAKRWRTRRSREGRSRRKLAL